MRSFLLFFASVVFLSGCSLFKGPRTEHKYSVTFVNNTSLPLEARGYLHERIMDDDCLPSGDDKKQTLAPGETYVMELIINCHGGYSKGTEVSLVKPYDIASMMVSNWGAVALLKPGFQFEMQDYDGQTRIPVQVIASPAPSDPQHPLAWSIPTIDQAQMAWLSEPGGPADDPSYELYVTVPKDTRASYMAFPKSTGVTDFGGNSLTFEDKGFFKQSVSWVTPGPSLATGMPSDKFTVTCNDVECSSL